MARNTTEIYEHLYKVVKSEQFLQKKGLGNEVPFFICPYNPSQAADMIQVRKQVVNKLKQDGIHVLDINLYDLSIEMLKERGLWDRILEEEHGLSKPELFDLLSSVLDPERNLIPNIGELIQADPEHHVMFLSGVGEIYPYLRSHTILNNLQSTAKEQPTLMFFPGEYQHSSLTGASLNLFSRLQNDKYYRAFNIFEYQV